MKFVLLTLLCLSFISCASHESREPSSVDDDVSRGINADRYYGGGFN
jgi:hypothetical protein